MSFTARIPRRCLCIFRLGIRSWYQIYQGRGAEVSQKIVPVWFTDNQPIKPERLVQFRLLVWCLDQIIFGIDREVLW